MVSFKGFDFEVLQLRFVKAAMDQLPTFRPDGKSPAEVQAMRDAAETMKGDYLSADTTLALARGELEELHQTAHRLATQVYAIMKSRYRQDHGSLTSINRLPTEDKTVRATRERMQAMSKLWGQLPNPPGSNQPFKAWDLMDRTAFDAVLTALMALEGPMPDIAQDYEKIQGLFHQKLDAIEDFVTAALSQGRAQFPEGTPEREVIDAIPMEQAQQPPAKPTITLAQSPGAGEVLLEFTAAHSTMFDIFQKGPGDADFVEIVTDTVNHSYSAIGLANGGYQFKVVGQNSLGNGPASEIATVTVGSGGGGGVPAAPGLPTLTNLGNGQVGVSWSMVAGALSYGIYKEIDGTNLGFEPSGSAMIPPATLTSLPPGETVRVRLTAVNANGESAPGPHAEITIPGGP